MTLLGERTAGTVACAALVLAGCALERAPILPGQLDAGAPPDAGADAATCPPLGCDDANPCTDDRCIVGTGCVFEPSTASCDDGMLCNGADTCVDGACVHDMVDPCPGASSCNPATNACEGCVTDADCPTEMRVPSGTCESPDTCATSGTEGVMVTAYTCEASGTCGSSTRAESQTCTRSTDGVSCGMAIIEPGDCSYGSACAESGSRTITTRTPVCMGGACEMVASMITDTSGCARSTAGTACGAPMVTMGSCGYASACAETATRTDTTTTPVCAAGACTGTMTSTSSAPCTRSTEGMTCGTCTSYGECAYTTPGACSGPAAQQRSCPACAGGSCPGAPTIVESRSCMPSGSGARCTQSAACTLCMRSDGTCPGGSTGTQTCTVTIGTCNAGGVCLGPTTTSTNSRPCTCP